MKWQALNANLLDFMALLSDDALTFFEKSLEKYDIVLSPFTIEINSYVAIHCLIDGKTATVLSFNYGRYAYSNKGISAEECEFIQALESKYFESNTYIQLSPKNRLKLLKL
ncbi:hypothetical protein M8853_11000 (plasmid) [Pasteurella multocida]|uniref:Uncharacterized protein n=1 Tax=Pasteurella canis TaxID=753 RepID=A0A379GE17_9PAST|nr:MULTISPECIES: hypothetical protein [Gammaproteobacteria]HBL4375310.1 hypothetical protein [Salmonella enterica subsp. enterica serovar Derby]KLT54233.1 hypothetical protein PMTHA_08175 [Pasteurella multocida subsp. multocida]KLT56529.1 hypothetical protein PMTHD_08190 [Pasteurella multocida subsp. multocida]KLT58772.1 hypothetical protein PESH_11315 [Pasteurella multocida subsp. multocida]KLT60441.1 hypothetical protein PMTHF_08185 [Pasteurella multocida subsp. multocida]